MDMHHDGQYGAPLVVPQGDTLFLQGGCQINIVFAVIVVNPSTYYLVSPSGQLFHYEDQAHLKSTS